MNRTGCLKSDDVTTVYIFQLCDMHLKVKTPDISVSSNKSLHLLMHKMSQQQENASDALLSAKWAKTRDFVYSTNLCPKAGFGLIQQTSGLIWVFRITKVIHVSQRYSAMATCAAGYSIFRIREKQVWNHHLLTTELLLVTIVWSLPYNICCDSVLYK